MSLVGKTLRFCEANSLCAVFRVCNWDLLFSTGKTYWHALGKSFENGKKYD